MINKELLKQFIELIELHEQEQEILAQLWSIRQQMKSLDIPFWDETINVQHGRKLYRVTLFQDSKKPKVKSFPLYSLLDEVKE